MLLRLSILSLVTSGTENLFQSNACVSGFSVLNPNKHGGGDCCKKSTSSAKGQYLQKPNTDLQAVICFGEGHKTIEGLQKREIPQSGICPAPCVPCLFTVVFA